MKSISKLFGNRVAFTLVEEDYDGMLLPAPTENKMHMLGRVSAIGDKARWTGIGDVVLWQWNSMIDRNNKFSLNGEPVFVLQEGDLIAALSSRFVKLENFRVLGNWCLVRRELGKPDGKIIVPDSIAENMPTVQFFLQQKGLGCCVASNTGHPWDVPLDVDDGDEVLVDRTRANPIQMDGKTFFYVEKPFIIGAVATT